MTNSSQGSLANTPFLEVICGLHKEARTGLLTISDGQADRTFHLRAGTLVASGGGGESESMDTLSKSLPDAPDSQLKELQRTLRILNCTNLTIGSWQFLDNATPGEESPSDLATTCWKAVQRKLNAENIRPRLAAAMESFPTTQGAQVPVGSLPVSEALQQFLSTIDGQRTLSEILDFAPLDPDQAARALYFGQLMGAIQAREEGRTVEITTRNAGAAQEAPDTTPSSLEPPDAPPLADDVLNIANLIADEVGAPAEHSQAGGDPSELSEDPQMHQLQETLNRLETATDHFQVLGVEWDADDTTYRTTYFELARTYHPDAWADKPQEQVEAADRIFAVISTAWQDLGESEARKAYVDKVIHGLQDENELAMERVKEILKAEANFDKAVAHFRAGRIVQAHEILENCVVQVPDAPEFRAYLGYTTWKLNEERDPEAAQKGEDMLKAAMENSVKLDNGWVLLGLVYKAKDLEDMAKMTFVKALKINPSNEFAVREMKRLSRDKKDTRSGGGLFGFFKKKK
jgi:tetratricopeptide (TPR) repeat protein